MVIPAASNGATLDRRPPLSTGRVLRVTASVVLRVALAIERLVPIRLPTQPTPPMRRPIKGGRKEPAACIDAPAHSLRAMQAISDGLRDASAAMAEAARGHRTTTGSSKPPGPIVTAIATPTLVGRRTVLHRRDASAQALAYVYCGAAAKLLLTRDEARRIAANIYHPPARDDSSAPGPRCAADIEGPVTVGSNQALVSGSLQSFLDTSDKVALIKWLV